MCGELSSGENKKQSNLKQVPVPPRLALGNGSGQEDARSGLSWVHILSRLAPGAGLWGTAEEPLLGAQKQAASPSRGRRKDAGMHQGALAVGAGMTATSGPLGRTSTHLPR